MTLPESVPVLLYSSMTEITIRFRTMHGGPDSHAKIIPFIKKKKRLCNPVWIKLITRGLLSRVKFVELRHKEKTQISTAFRFKNATKVTFSFFYLIIYYILLRLLNLFKNIK